MEGGGVSSPVFCVETERSILLNTSTHWGPSSLALPTLLKEAERTVLISLKELYIERKELFPSLQEHKAEVQANSPYSERDHYACLPNKDEGIGTQGELVHCCSTEETWPCAEWWEA